jgi:uncharacterized protein (TIGR02001 family)
MKRAVSGAAGVAAVIVVSTLGSVGHAQEVEVSGNVAILSDYAFRGVSQTLEEPAIQGGLDLSLPANLYVGVWASNVQFGETVPDRRAHMELDLYGGIAPSVAGLDLDVGVLYYAYPGAHSDFDYNFLEIFGGVSRGFGPLTAGLTGAYSPDFFAASGTGLYGALEATAELSGTPLAVDASVGRQSIEDNAAFGTPNYTVWSAGISADVYRSAVGLSVTGTDLSKENCFGGSDLCKARVILSISRGL